MKRGYYAIGIYKAKTDTNIGTLWRSAQNFGANFIFTISKRYQKERSDTTKAWLHIPLHHYTDWDDFLAHVPKDADLVFVEQASDARTLHGYPHPERAIYILGAEDEGIPPELMRGHRKVQIPTPMCLNVAVAGSIVMYARLNP